MSQQFCLGLIFPLQKRSLNIWKQPEIISLAKGEKTKDEIANSSEIWIAKIWRSISSIVGSLLWAARKSSLSMVLSSPFWRLHGRYEKTKIESEKCNNDQNLTWNWRCICQTWKLRNRGSDQDCRPAKVEETRVLEFILFCELVVLVTERYFIGELFFQIRRYINCDPKMALRVRQATDERVAVIWFGFRRKQWFLSGINCEQRLIGACNLEISARISENDITSGLVNSKSEKWSELIL